MRSTSVFLAAGLLIATACGSDDPSDGATITLVTYDSFPAAETPINDGAGGFSCRPGVQGSAASPDCLLGERIRAKSVVKVGVQAPLLDAFTLSCLI